MVSEGTQQLVIKPAEAYFSLQHRMSIHSIRPRWHLHSNFVDQAGKTLAIIPSASCTRMIYIESWRVSEGRGST